MLKHSIYQAINVLKAIFMNRVILRNCRMTPGVASAQNAVWVKEL
jgi:hypothetical protein